MWWVAQFSSICTISKNVFQIVQMVPNRAKHYIILTTYFIIALQSKAIVNQIINCLALGLESKFLWIRNNYVTLKYMIACYKAVCLLKRLKLSDACFLNSKQIWFLSEVF